MNNNNKKDANAAYRPYGYASYAIGKKAQTSTLAKTEFLAL